jgi:type 1 glutamine amidotransferase
LQSTDGNSTQPTLWVNENNLGRVVYNALGHDLVSVSQLTHQQLIKRSALWACRAADFEVEAITL